MTCENCEKESAIFDLYCSGCRDRLVVGIDCKLLASRIAKDIEKKFGVKGRVHFNVGGASAIEDAIKIVRNHTKKNSVFAFMGSYHGRTLGATAITSS